MFSGDDRKGVKFSSFFFLVCIVVGVLMTVGIIFAINVPSNIAEGERAKETIQMLDAMRRPFLKVKEAEIELIETGNIKSASDNFTKAMKSAETLLEKYLELSQYNPKVHDNVTELKKEYDKWMVEERHLFNHYAEVSRLADEIVLKDHFITKLSTASSHFMSTMNRLGDAEVPIHNDMDAGSRAVRLLMVFSGLFFLYLMGLIFLYQSVKKREIGKSNNELQKEVKERERAKEGLLQAQSIAHLGSWEWEIEAGGLEWSDEIYKIFGLEPGEFGATYEAFLEAVHPDDRELVMRSVDEALYKGEHYDIEHRIVTPSSMVRTVHEVGKVFYDDEGKPLKMIGTVHDITDRKEVEENLRELTAQLNESLLFKEKILDESPIGITIYDESGQCILSNSMIAELIGARREDVLKQNFHHIESWKKSGAYEMAISALKNKRLERMELSVTTTFGKYVVLDCHFIPFTSEDKQYLMFMAEDFSKRKEAEDKLKELTYLDELTGVANRRFYNKTIANEWNRALRWEKDLSMIIIDIDNFKLYNDTLGHTAGDECLQSVAQALNSMIFRAGDLFARYGGEEFVVVLPSVDLASASHFAEMMRTKVQSLGIKHPASEVSEHVTISLGVASIVPDKESCSEELIIMADTELYRAKEAGRNCVRVSDTA